LELTQRIRRFASDELGLPDNPSYTAYADLPRAAAVWNVVAAPPYSLTLKSWCFPVAGCVGYRGYYSEEAAKAEAEAQQRQDLEVSVYPVPA
ncbi:aminopeptidase, partial [Xylella fastidiosa subsp. multiplex]|nr:aminopeptidase [Xylella fastidiosa subsp. multiplex]